ncbi:hypothetical protein DES53_102714 [Roseimicrobium gellanilyticum]|uniref:Uncharacterized protein n=2 Tax=Roseimicrobium gellanilyticum TaxID=748857 RepID=A0A366HRL7_9BACT|nr:hypothetical protein DES53_102714 [Roseimicrobium gellanilyticum]
MHEGSAMSFGEAFCIVVPGLPLLASGAVARPATRPCLWQAALVAVALVACWLSDGTPYGKLAVSIWALGAMTFAFMVGLALRWLASATR